MARSPYDTYSPHDHPVPYVLDLRDGERRLVYFGARHTWDPSDPALRQLEERFAEARPCVVLNEGGEPDALDDRDQAIRYAGEAGLLRHLARAAGAHAANMDLPLTDEARWLAERHGREATLLFLVVRQLASYNAMRARPPLERYLADYVHDIGAALGWSGVAVTDVYTTYIRVFGEPLVPSQVAPELTDPVPQRWPTQRIARESSVLRDQRMAHTILDALERHGRVFAAAGVTHVVMQERELRERFAAPGYR
jgi:hypothetical protein